MDATEEPTLVIVDDHEALRTSLEMLLRSQGVRVVGTAGTASYARQVVEARRPDVVLLDVALGGDSGIDLAVELLESDPSRGILLYTGLTDDAHLERALEIGARGVALKAGSRDELVTAIRTVAAGGTYLDPRLGRRLLSSRNGPPLPVLTPRQREILGLLAQGLTGEQVARELYLSPETVRVHIRNAMEKLGARTRTHAIVVALEAGEIVASPPE